MSQQKPFRVEVPMPAPAETVWHALTDERELHRWFGWEYAGLTDEIRYIFFDHARAVPEHTRIELDDGQRIEVATDGGQALLRAVAPGDHEAPEVRDQFDGMEEGWLTFFHQLRYYLAHHRGRDRRTLYLQGVATPATVWSAVEATATATYPWQSGRYQRALTLGAPDGPLVSVLAKPGMDSPVAGKLSATITFFDIADLLFDQMTAQWKARWSEVTGDGRVTTRDETWP